MADVDISTTRITRASAGALGFPSANLDKANDEYVINNDGATVLAMQNDHATAAVTVIVQTPDTANRLVDGLAVPNREYTIPAVQTRYAGPFPANVYGAELRVSASGTGDLKVAAFRV